MDLTGWVYILTFGKDVDIYARDGERVGIDRSMGKVVIRYEVKSKAPVKGGAVKDGNRRVSVNPI